MTAATTLTQIDQTSDAAFRAWIAEIITALFTTVGLTQTADTGQINTATVTRPAGANASAGYVIGRFNDTAQSSSPIFFKMEFGTGNIAVTSPNLYITVGTGSNGSGTITGTTSTRASICGGLPASNTIQYPSRFCYNATMGVLGFSEKITSIGGGNLFSLLLARSTDASGAPTTDSYFLVYAATGSIPTASTGQSQNYSYLTPGFVTVGASTSFGWDFGGLITNFNVPGKVFPSPIFILTPAPQVLASAAIVLTNDMPVHTSLFYAIVGATAHTFLNIGAPWAATAFAAYGNLLMLFE